MQNKVSVITGASSGIGRATSILFAQRGATVVAVGRKENELSMLAEEVKEAPGSLSTFIADVEDPDQVDKLVTETIDEFGRINVLVNAAGTIKNGSIENTSLSEWDQMLGLNLRTVFYLMHKCVPFLEATSGNIVNVSSVTGLRAFPNVLAYCVSKAGIDQLTRCSALELAPKGVRVNAVNPGVVVTNLHKRGGMGDADYEKFLEHSRTTHPIGRAGTAEEVAELIAFLASDQASWITGATYAIDGGRSQTCAR